MRLMLALACAALCLLAQPGVAQEAAQAAQQSPQTALTVPREVLAEALLLGLWLPAPVAGGQIARQARAAKRVLAQLEACLAAQTLARGAQEQASLGQIQG